MGNLLRGEGNGLNFTINGNVHHYLFASEIYLQWNYFVQIIKVFTLLQKCKSLVARM
jgi:hypothetical protein